MEPNDQLQKAITISGNTLTAANGGLLNAEQANTFIDLTVDNSALIKMCRILRVNNVAGEFGKLNFGAVVTEKATENTDTGHVYEPTHSKIEYTTKKLRSAMDITTEVYEENIEGEGYQNTVMTALGKRIATDLELLAIKGDTTTYAAENGTPSIERTYRLLRANDGWYKQAIAGNYTVDCAGGNITHVIFSKMIRALPIQYKVNRAALRFFVSPSILQDYRDALADRLTNLGDQNLVGNDAVRVFGIPIVEIPLIPEDLDSLDGSDDWNDASWIWLTYPQNFIHVISREIEVYWEYQPRKDAWETTLYTRTDDIIENTDAIVTGYDLRVKGAS